MKLILIFFIFSIQILLSVKFLKRNELNTPPPLKEIDNFIPNSKIPLSNPTIEK